MKNGDNSAFDKIKGVWYAVTCHVRKNIRMVYYLRGFSQYVLPDCIARKRLNGLLASFGSQPSAEQDYIIKRVDYYCKFSDSIHLPADAPELKGFTYKKREAYGPEHVKSVYFFDAYEYLRFFPKSFRWAYCPGDIAHVLPVPEICKSRPIAPDDSNRNNILLKLNKVRHFIWVRDPFKWEEKDCRILYRGEEKNKPRRIRFIEMWQGHPLCDIERGGNMSIYEHLHYKYIMALEGNDVASNLKWVMSSNSIAVMPRPTCETWFMEGQLIPNYHYIEIADDYHDLTDRIMYYEAHPEEAKAIISHAHEWVSQFKNKKREKLISLMVLDRYFHLTGQSYSISSPSF